MAGMIASTSPRVDPWPLPLIPSARSVARKTRSRLLHEDDAVQIVAWACGGDCEELRAERTHSHHVVTVLRRGACTIEQGGRSVAVDAASIVVHRPGSTYVTRHPWGYVDAGWSVAYDDAIAEETLAACRAPRRPAAPSRLVHVRRLRAVADVVTALFRLEHRETTDPIDAQGAAIHLLAMVHDPDAFSWVPSDPARRAERSLVDRACESLRARLGDPVRLADVARDVGCSEFRLYRAFRRQRGTSPGAYLRSLRLAAVLDALAAGAPSLTDVALDAGFASHSHMTSTFRRHLGRTPRGVRREIGDEGRRGTACAHDSLPASGDEVGTEG